MSKSKVKSDTHSLYVRHQGYLFRPVFPTGYDPKNPSVDIKEGDQVTCYYNGQGKYVRLNFNGEVLYWMKHGSYIVAHGDTTKHVESNNILLGD